MDDIKTLNEKIELLTRLNSLTSKENKLLQEMVSSLKDANISLKNMYEEMTDKMELFRTHFLIITDIYECRITILENMNKVFVTQMSEFLGNEKYEKLTENLKKNYEETLKNLLNNENLSDKVKAKITSLTPSDYFMKIVK